MELFRNQETKIMATQFETELKIANFRKQVYFIVAIVTTITAIATIVTIE